jgi:hypothetical protein
MSYIRRNSFEKKVSPLLKVSLSTRYNERKFKEYLADDDEDSKSQKGVEQDNVNELHEHISVYLAFRAPKLLEDCFQDPNQLISFSLRIIRIHYT